MGQNARTCRDVARNPATGPGLGRVEWELHHDTRAANSPFVDLDRVPAGRASKTGGKETRTVIGQWARQRDQREGSAPDPPADPISYLGVNIGALSVKVVRLRGADGFLSRVVPHQGRPLEVLDRLLVSAEFAGERFVGVSGHLGHIPEVAAIQRGLKELAIDLDAVVSLGGESFLVYTVAGRRVLSVLSHNKCAAGSGEFFVQQIGRMGLSMDEAIDRSFEGRVVPLAARCSVHCKSDITHKLNRQEASVEDILRTLHDSMADKVVALLQRTRPEPGRILLIGGVVRNRAMVAALGSKLPGTELVVLPQSTAFEAWGAALLARDDPRHASPQLRVKSALQRLPPLRDYGDRVQRTPPPPRPPLGAGPFVLGVDAGSTTTKAVLLDPETRTVVASHYGRTSGDPIRATKECLRALVGHVGNRPIRLVGTTGSARDLVGAFLGTERVYNEISAQAAGAAHHDPEVDTIFEIGGQDSKYIHLRQGVPVDYAMNAACAAGTGSFLEESARGDLGIPVTGLAEIALRAAAPVQFKATCAAFINSDIRIALQEGCSAEDIAAGLVYAVADNYLTKVKGTRFVGKRVFLQGGVALNRAVGCAFAHSVGRTVVIPPHPELLGAHGVALLALERARGAPAAATDLLALARPEMRRVGGFTCKACGMFCTIDRFEVAGRRFPFGGRCSLFENVWKRKARVAPAPDLVEERARLVFPPGGGNGRAGRMRIGVPRALTVHSLYPLYATFLERLGLDVVLSGVDPGGALRVHSGFCFPVQIAHGAVLDLARQGVREVFFPHVVRMPNPRGAKDSYLCPLTQAGPYVLAQAFPDTRFLSPELDFGAGYEGCRALVDLACDELGVPRALAGEAYDAAVEAQLGAERSLRALGRRALSAALRSDRPAIVLVGRSYNAFTPEASQSVARKLASMGVPAIPADCLEPTGRGTTSWHYPNTIVNAVAHVQRHDQLFLLYVTNFSCTIDSFTHAMLSSELGAKPCLVLEIDAHTADAGLQTRLEAFLDIIHNFRRGRTAPGRRFEPARLGRRGRVVRASGEEVPLTDPRVKLHFPAFSRYHSRAWAMAARWLGLHPGPDLVLDRRQLERGLRHTSGRECLPLPICVGQMLQINDGRQAGEVHGLLMLRGGAPCVVDCFMGYFERFIAQHRLEDLFVFSPHAENDYCGLDAAELFRHFTPAILVADLMVEIGNALAVVGGPGGLEGLERCWGEFVADATTLDAFQEHLPRLVDALAGIPRIRAPADCPRVIVTGDFFTRFSGFFMEGVPELYAERGIILKPVDLNELVLYGLYDGLHGMAHHWGLEPGARATLKACTRILQADGKEYLVRSRQYHLVRQAERDLRRRFERTGLLVAGPTNIQDSFSEARRHISPAIFGEAIPAVGKGLRAAHEGFDGVILIGPFNCLPFRISEAILKPRCDRSGAPLLTYESDGYAVSPSFLRQVDVHVQQVLDRRDGRRRGARPVPPARGSLT